MASSLILYNPNRVDNAPMEGPGAEKQSVVLTNLQVAVLQLLATVVIHALVLKAIQLFFSGSEVPEGPCARRTQRAQGTR